MKKVLLFVLISFSFLFGQGVSVRDTISAVALQKFKVPARKQIVLTNIKQINSFRASLLDAGMNKIKDLTEFYQDPKQLKGGQRGETVVYEVYGMVEEAGTYYVKIDFSFVDETASRSVSGYYKLNVDNPTMSAKVNIRETYFPNEKETFSFATAEYTDPSQYSYVIQTTGGQELFSGTGPIVNLNEVLKSDNAVGQTFEVIGKYNGQEFKFKEFETGELKDTRWTFSVSPPTLSAFVTWKDLTADEETKAGEAYYISPFNKKLLRFFFIYTGYVEEDGSLVVSPVNVRNLSITSEPSDFLAPGRGGNFKKAGYFTIIELDVNQAFIDGMEIGDEMPVKIKMRFSTQFESNKEYEYESTIIM